MSEKIYGRKPVLEALRATRGISRLYIMKGAREEIIDQIEAHAQAKGVSVVYETRHRLTDLAGTDNHQGVVAVVEPKKFVEISDVLDEARRKAEPLFAVILDELEDPQNLGAILRSSEAAGVHGVVIPKHRAADVTATVTKASAGAAEHVPIVKVANLNEAIRKFKDEGAWVVGADMDGTQVYYEYDFTRPTVILVGSEGKGLRRLVKENCDTMLKIPMYGKVGSLNASVSAALLMYEVVRQRKWKKTSPVPAPPSTPSSWNTPSFYQPPASASNSPSSSGPTNPFFQRIQPTMLTNDRNPFIQAVIRLLKRRLRVLFRA